MPPGRGSAAERKFLAPPTTASAQCLHLSERFFHYLNSLSVSRITKKTTQTTFTHIFGKATPGVGQGKKPLDFGGNPEHVTSELGLRLGLGYGLGGCVNIIHTP